MKTKPNKKIRPWLTPTGVELSTLELRGIADKWGRATWEAYLKWYEAGRRENLIRPDTYEWICEEQFESVFQEFAQESSPENRSKCRRELSKLPPLEAAVLERIFLQGKTQAEIAFAFRRSRTGISHIKNRALLRLKRGNHGHDLSLCRFMEGEESFMASEAEPSIWDEPMHEPPKEDRFYDPSKHHAEFDRIRSASLKDALLALTDTAQRIIYLRFWCAHSLSDVARILGRGINVVEQIESASISKVKRHALEFELGPSMGGF